jgi:hypothetical protein
VVGGGLKDRGRDGTRDNARFVLFSEWWWVVDSKIEEEMGQEKMQGIILASEWWWVMD